MVEAEEKLKESEEQFQNLFNNMREGFALCEIILDERGIPKDYRFLKINPAFGEQSGMDVEASIGKTIRELYPDIEPIWIKRYGNVALTGESINFVDYNHNTKRYYDGMAFSPSKGKVAMIFRDITKRMEAEEALRISEAKFKTIVSNSKPIVFAIEKDGKFILSEGRDLASINLKPGQVIGMSAFEMYKDNPEITRGLNEAMAGRSFQSSTKINHTHFDFFISPWRNGTGDVIGVLGMALDVTDREGALVEVRKTARYMNQIADSIVVLNRKAEIVRINKAFTNLWGYGVEDVLGKSVFDLFPEREHAKHKAKMGIAAKTGKVQMFETIALTKDGREVPVSMNGAVIFNTDGQVVEIVGVFRNITEAKGVEKELEDRQKALLNLLEDIQEEKDISEDRAKDLLKFQLAVENTTDHIVITDLEGKIIYANKAAEKLTGFNQKEIIGNNPRLWGGQMSPEYYKKMWKIIKFDKKPFVGEIINKRKSGKKYEAAVRISPVLDKEEDIIFFVGLERDITAQKKAERSKTEFVSLASHQLQTPLTSVRWNAELILDSDKEIHNLTDKQKKYVTDLYSSTVRTIELVNSLLNVSRIELGTINVDPEPTDIKSICVSSINEIRREALDKNIKIETFYDPDLSLINVDPIFFRMIIINLLSNAVKYTNSGGSMKLEVTKDEKRMQIKISDTGVGIPKAQQNKIYTKFFRANNAQVLSEGSGLGLYIVKSVLEKTGGKIWFESEENKGTTFYIELPLTGMRSLKGTKGFSFT